ncbi:MAG: hypothetical protein K2G55_00030 [Lachnospiraceae bacterium]|nr:hypothetical protein [Lachnospiraceae bacterium]MDE7205256.1 hypothetical protein [Lachnospiraceae bacterium]
MNEDTRQEVIKALAYGESVEDIANMAEVETGEIERINEEYADEIRRRQEVITGGMGYGN